MTTSNRVMAGPARVMANGRLSMLAPSAQALRLSAAEKVVAGVDE